MKRLRRLGWLLVGVGAVLLLAPPAMIAYESWEESTITQQWEAQLSARARHVPAQPAAMSTAQEPEHTAPPPLGTVSFVLKIPRLGYNAAVREGVSSSVLGFGPGHYPTTPEPGQPGDVGVAAHNTFWLGFGSVKPGDQIILQTKDGTTYTYVVTGTRIVTPDETWVLDRPGGKRLTLTTCWPLWAGALARQRLAIFAKMSPKPVGAVV